MHSQKERTRQFRRKLGALCAAVLAISTGRYDQSGNSRGEWQTTGHIRVLARTGYIQKLARLVCMCLGILR